MDMYHCKVNTEFSRNHEITNRDHDITKKLSQSLCLGYWIIFLPGRFIWSGSPCLFFHINVLGGEKLFEPNS